MDLRRRRLSVEKRVPSHFKVKPRRGWLFRTVGFCVCGALIDYDDSMDQESARKAGDLMLGDDVKYKPHSVEVFIYDVSGELLESKKRGG